MERQINLDFCKETAREESFLHFIDLSKSLKTKEGRCIYIVENAWEKRAIESKSFLKNLMKELDNVEVYSLEELKEPKVFSSNISFINVDLFTDNFLYEESERTYLNESFVNKYMDYFSFYDSGETGKYFSLNFFTLVREKSVDSTFGAKTYTKYRKEKDIVFEIKNVPIVYNEHNFK